MKKCISTITLLMLCLTLLVSCKSKPNESGSNDQLPAGFVRDIYTSGGMAVDNANLSSVALSDDSGITRISMSFICGSKISDGTNESNAPGVPLYSIYTLESPHRLVVEFSSISYWDHERSDMAAAGCVIGSFSHMLLNSETYSLYFQLNNYSAVSVSEDGYTLNISLYPEAERAARNTADPSGSFYYVVADAYRDYCSGIVSREMDMHPTLADDLSQIVLISGGFSSKTEAEIFKADTLSENEKAIEAEWSIAALKANELPHYDEELGYAAAYSVKNARVGGEEISLDVLIPDGHYLAMTPDKEILYSKRLITGGLGDDAYTYEQLCIRTHSGEVRPLLRFEFETIENVAYSPDYRKLAVLERAAESTHLYIFDLDTKELLTDLTEVGFGDMISTFTWDNMGTRLFAISGSSSMIVNQYDFNVPNEANRYSVVEKNGADEGSIAYHNGEVYFVETDIDKGAAVYKIKPDGGVRKRLYDGSIFRLSNDGAYMAVSKTSEYSSQEQAQKSEFSLYDMATGESALITDEFVVYDYIWSDDCARIYYFQNRIKNALTEGEEGGGESENQDADADPYPYTLWMYDVAAGKNTVIADLPYQSIAVSQAYGGILLCYYDSETMGEKIRATYILNK